MFTGYEFRVRGTGSEVRDASSGVRRKIQYYLKSSKNCNYLEQKPYFCALYFLQMYFLPHDKNQKTISNYCSAY
jgi:hypothetical protein